MQRKITFVHHNYHLANKCFVVVLITSLEFYRQNFSQHLLFLCFRIWHLSFLELLDSIMNSLGDIINIGSGQLQKIFKIYVLKCYARHE